MMTSTQSLQQLELFLQEHFPNDVLCPVKKETKQPAFHHKNGKWGWTEWQRERATCVGKNRLNVCIILKDIVCIDVDSVEQALDLEERFPILTVCPMVRQRPHVLLPYPCTHHLIPPPPTPIPPPPPLPLPHAGDHQAWAALLPHPQ